MSEILAEKSPVAAAQASGSLPDDSRALQLAQFSWQAIRQPAALAAGKHLLSPHLRKLAENFMALACRAAENVANRNVAAVWKSGHGSIGAAFGIAVESGPSEEFLLVLDLGASRALVEPLTVDLAGLRGSGGLTDAETGLLEFIAIDVIDRISRNVPATSNWRAREFLRANQIHERAAAFNVGPILVTINVGGQSGTAALWIKNLATLNPPDGFFAGRPIEGPCVPLCLSLKPLSLSAEEFDRVRPADIIAPGISDLSALPCDLIVAATGWSIGAGIVNRWTAGAIHVKPGQLLPNPICDVEATPQAGRVWIRPVLGLLEMTETQFVSTFGSGGIGFGLDFSFNAENPVELYRCGKIVAHAEAIVVDGELGFRILDRFPEDGEGSNAV